MGNPSASLARRASMSERATAQQQLHFPNVRSEWLWSRADNHGFSTIPRTLPLVMQAIDAQSKGQPAGHTLFCLWARAPDASMLVIESPAVFAYEAGFRGARAVDTWRRRMKQLAELHFIGAKPGVSGDFHYVLLLNPNVAMEQLFRDKKVQQELYFRFIDRVVEIGAGADIDAIRAVWEEEAAADTQTAAPMSSKAAPAPKRKPPKPAGRGGNDV